MGKVQTVAVVVMLVLGLVAVGTSVASVAAAGVGEVEPVDMPDPAAVWAEVVEFFTGAQLRVLLGLIGLDLALGVAAAIRRGEFDWEEVGRFYQTAVLPGVLGYLALYVAFGLIPVLEGVVGEGLQWTGFGVLVLRFGGSIGKSLSTLGILTDKDTARA